MPARNKKNKQIDTDKNNEQSNNKAPEKKISIKTSLDESGLDFSVVGIGASAGGLEALEQFFSNMPHDSGLAFVVVQHLSPDYKSLMVELLSKHTKMSVLRIEDGMQLKPNSVYLIPPKKNLTMFHGKLYLTDQGTKHMLNLPIDIFFRSLAEDLGERAIGCILSGTGSDGTLGIRAIKGAGGMAMVQEESSAKFDGMPKSAIATGLVDYIQPAEKMPAQLMKYVKHPYVAKTDNTDKFIREDEDTLSKILALIRTRTGTDFTYYKPNTIIRRVERRISINQLENIENYLNLLVQSPSELNILYKELLIGVTKFFRDSEAIEVIQKKVIPNIFKNKSKTDEVRIWVVGCSTGEEAYSIAILMREYMEYVGKTYDLKIFATDIDRESVEYASAGVYPDNIVADVSEERLKNFFKKNNNTFKVNENIRQMVIFASHNIIKDPPFSKIDMITCRNLLIYFQPVMQKKVLSLFSFSLITNGYLFLGTSESVGDLTPYFTPVDNKWKVFQSKEGLKSAVANDYYIPTVKKRPAPMIQLDTAQGNKKNDTKNLVVYVQDMLFKDFVPPAIIINKDYELLHTFGDLSDFLQIPAGKVDLNIMNHIREDLSVAVGTAIHKAMKENREVFYKDMVIKRNEKLVCINLTVKPVNQDKDSKELFLIVFSECKPKESQEKEFEQFDMGQKVHQRIEDLELELKYTKESLQATIEELETSNEELQATNEELIASNEELQSTNEELQSVNEELYTVNSEYQNKIEELTELNNDINNWFNVANIGTIFLDLNLRIRKFTPAIEKFINLLDSDVGRPIKHISYNFKNENFFEEIDGVLKSLQPVEKEVQTKSGGWFLLKILPYRTIENAVKGIVITFIDITDMKVYEQKLANEKELLLRVLDNSPTGKMQLDKNGDFIYMNKRSEELLGFSLKDLQKEKYNTPVLKIRDIEGNPIPEKELPFRRIMDSKEPIYDMINRITRPDGREITLSINGAPVFDINGTVIGAVFSIDDLERMKVSRDLD